MELGQKEQNIRLESSRNNIMIVVEKMRDEIESLIHRWHRFKTD